MTAFATYQQEQVKQLMALPAKMTQHVQSLFEITTKINEEFLVVKKDPQEQMQHFVQLMTNYCSPEQPHQKRLQEWMKNIQQDVQETQQKQQQLTEELLKKVASGQDFLPNFLQAGAATSAKTIENVQKLSQQTLDTCKAQAEKFAQVIQDAQKTGGEALAHTQKAAAESVQQGQKAVQDAVQYSQKAAADAFQQAQKAFSSIQSQYAQAFQPGQMGGASTHQQHAAQAPASQQQHAQAPASQQQMNSAQSHSTVQPGSAEPTSKQK